MKTIFTNRIRHVVAAMACALSLTACDEEPIPEAEEPEGAGPGAPFTCADVGGREFQFLAHADGERDTPFLVGRQRDGYFNFTFRAPWTRNVYAKIITPVIGNDQVLHHWLFFKNDSSADGDLRVERSSGAHIQGELVEGWAPGGSTHHYGKNLGRVLEPGWYTLEIHYNSNDRNATDRSGVSICYVEEEPKNIAELVWLGEDSLLSRRVWTGECEPRGPFPIHLLSVTPHMHVEGRWMKAVINRADGTQEILHDRPFTFDSQVTYNFANEVLIHRGDTITTTCTYATPKRFGTATTDEMCYLYVLAWPEKALRSSGGLVHGPNTCM